MAVPLVLEVAISMVFLYLLGSQVVLSIYELWAGYTNSRGKFLYRQLKGTIGENTAQVFYNQPTIAFLSPANQATPKAQTGAKQQFGVDNHNAINWWLGFDGLPAYISADLFASTLLAMVAPKAATNIDIINALNAAGSPGADRTESPIWLSEQIQTLLRQLLEGLSPDSRLEDCQKRVALWYDAYGERLTGWYKRRVRVWLFLLGLIIALIGNIDSPFIIRYLWAHPPLSSNISDKATLAVQSGDVTNTDIVKAKTPNVQNGLTRTTKLGTRNDSARNTKIAQRVDSLAQLLRLSNDHVQTLTKRLHGLGFPIGRTDSAGRDSMLLPSLFFVHHPLQAVHRGQVLEVVPAHYVRYERRDTTLKASTVRGLFSKATYWHRKAILAEYVSAKDLESPHDRSYQYAWYEPFFGPQSQSAWQTLIGWLLTAAALSLGAPFWFDLLCRLVNIRNLGIKPRRTD